MSALLLDTCAALWFMNGDPMRGEAVQAIEDAAAGGVLWVSAVTAWEVALKSRQGRPDSPKLNNGTAADWYRLLIGLSGVREAPLTGEIALLSASLPPIHRDPADRFLIATAIQLRAPLMTTDRHIMAYADAGLIQVETC